MPIRRSAVALVVLALGGSVPVQRATKTTRSVECDAFTDVKYRIAETTKYCKGTKGKAAFKLAWDVTAKTKESVRIDVKRANGDEIFNEISQGAMSNEIEIPEVLCRTGEISLCVSRWNKKGRTLKTSKRDSSDGDSLDGDSSDGDSLDGDSSDGDSLDGDSSDGDSSDGDSSDGTKCCQKVPLPQCPSGFTCKDPILQGLRGQNVKWVGEEGAWYALFVDEEIDMQVNVRTTGPLPEDFPDRQYVTGVSILQHGHSLVIEVVEPYSGDTPGCPESFFPCLADGGLRFLVDGKVSQRLARPTRKEKVGDIFELSSSNLPVECREFGGGEEWDLLYEEMRRSHRELAEPSFKEWVLSFPHKMASEWDLLYEEIRRGDGEVAEPGFEEWLLSFPHKVAPEWCAKYVSEIGLADVQSKQSVLKIATADIVVRFSVGVNHRHGGKTDRLGRELPELDFWQSSVGLSGINLENEHLTGLLGETSRPVQDTSGHVIMKGVDAIRGTVADYRVSGPAGKDFRLLHLDESTTP